MQAFDHEFEGLLEEANIAPVSSRLAAIARIKKELEA
jgi:hypothetical protein